MHKSCYCRVFHLPHPRLSPPSTHGLTTVTRKSMRGIYLWGLWRESRGLYKFPPFTRFCLFGRCMTHPIALLVGWPCGRVEPNFAPYWYGYILTLAGRVGEHIYSYLTLIIFWRCSRMSRLRVRTPRLNWLFWFRVWYNLCFIY